MSNPADLLYAKTHEWARVEGGEAVVGLTHFAQDALGDITYVEVPAEGDTVTAGREMGSVESVKAASDIISPVSGEVVAVNPDLESAPEKINADPWGTWLIRVKLSGRAEGLLDAAAYGKHCESEHH